ncbi:MAG: DMT family transporter [Candidatus Heimdallarchaeota archaeon]
MLAIYFLLILMISIWSFSFIVVDVLIEFIPSLSIAFYRFTIASIAYLLIDLYQTLNKRKIDENNNLNLNKAYSKRDWIYIFISSLFGVSLFFFTQYSSINLIGPSIPALFVCLLAPVIIATLAIIFFKEKLGKIKIFGFIIATFGGFLLISGGTIENLTPLSPNFLGYMFALMTPVFWAIYSTISKKIGKTSSANRMNKYICYLGTIELLILLLINQELEILIQNLSNPVLLLSSIYLGVGCYVIGYYIWQYAQKKLKSAKVASFLYIEPFLTLFFSLIFQRSDEVVIWNVLGGIIVLIAVLLINYERIH